MEIALGLIAAVAFAVAQFVSLRTGREDGSLRRCPLCASDAVAAGDRTIVGASHVQVRLRCGQCGVWRSMVAPHWAARQLDRRLDADRRAIASRASRLAHERAASESLT